jgi:outer membrane autotransporter protein
MNGLPCQVLDLHERKKTMKKEKKMKTGKYAKGVQAVLAATLFLAIPSLSQASVHGEGWVDPFTETSQVTLRNVSSHIVRQINRQIISTMRSENAMQVGAIPAQNEVTGLSAGDRNVGLNIWINGGYVDSDDSQIVAPWDSKLYTFMVGGDKSLTDAVSLGLALTYENLDMETIFNNGDLDSTGLTLSPYLAMQFSDIITGDIIVGYSRLSSDQNRNAVMSSYDSDRIFWSVNLNAFKSYDAWNVSATLGYTQTTEDQDAYTEGGFPIGANELKIGQLSLGGEVGYQIKNFEPYLSAAVEKEVKDDIRVGGGEYDDLGYLVGLGVRYMSPGGLTAELNVDTTQGRDDLDEYSVMLNLRMSF